MINYGEASFIIMALLKLKKRDKYLTQFKLKVNDTYEEDKEVTTNFEPYNPVCITNKRNLDRNLAKKNGLMSFKEKILKKFTDLERSNKQSDEEFVYEGAVKMTLQNFYVEGLFNKYHNAAEVLRDYLTFEGNERRRLDLDQKQSYKA